METMNYETATVKISFDSLPAAIQSLHEKLDRILSKSNFMKEPDNDIMMDIEGLRNYLPEHPARQTIYGWVNNRLIPFEKHGKKLYFSKNAVQDWILSGRKF